MRIEPSATPIIIPNATCKAVGKRQSRNSQTTGAATKKIVAAETIVPANMDKKIPGVNKCSKLKARHLTTRQASQDKGASGAAQKEYTSKRDLLSLGTVVETSFIGWCGNASRSQLSDEPWRSEDELE